jgi:arabinogalactan endo-1,4-beta-galactosidase
MTTYGTRRAGKVAVFLTVLESVGVNYVRPRIWNNDDGTANVYWEPTWYAVPGNGWDLADITNSGDGWENQAVFDRTGRLNPTIR